MEIANNRQKAKSFTDLTVYNLANELALEISKITETFPKKEQYRIVDQLLRAVYSIGANIAEGYGRYHRKELVKFLYNARGSLMEVKHFMILSHKLNYIDGGQFEKIDDEIKTLGIKLNNFIKGVSKLF